MEPLISVIVPIYNVEKYLDQCIESIVNQTYRNLEIILVDDGSPDNCPEKCEKWAQKDPRIKVIHKDNAGLGFARNSGLDIAQGRYVVFIDSDDFVDVRMIETLYQQIDDGDVIYCGLNRFHPDGTTEAVESLYFGETFEQPDIVDKILLRMLGNIPEKDDGKVFYMSVWHALYSNDLIQENHIRFPSEREFMCEDIAFHVKFLCCAAKAKCIPDNLYYYRYNPNSLSTKVDPTRFSRIKDMHRKLVDKLSVRMEKERFQVIEAGWFLSLSRGQIVSAVRRKGWRSLSDVKTITSDPLVRQTLAVFPYQRNPFPRRIFNFLIHRRWNMLIVIAVKCYM